MSKFHINKHGVPAPCKAKSGNCPLGGMDSHYDTRAKAQAAIDLANQKKHGILPVVENNKRTVNDSNIPDFYAIHDDVHERFYEFIEEGGSADFDHPTFTHLSNDEKYEVWVAGFSKVDYIEAFNDSYNERDFDYMSDKMAQHLVDENAIESADDFESHVEKDGKENTFKKFNNFVFNGEFI